MSKGRANWCVHFNGMSNDTCKIGIEYDSVKSEGEMVNRNTGETKTQG